jgi:outer membrane protein OmpA-like peptidoglycan-associated protein/tetratricopeptide (TPR) repeat protein
MHTKQFLLLCVSLCISFNLNAQRELFERADAFYSQHLYKEAILAYEKALKVDPKQPKAIVRLAKSYEMTNNLPKAEAYYEEAIKYNSTQESIFEYAQMLKANGKIDEAKQWFLKYEKFNKEKAEHFANSCDFVKVQSFAPILFELHNLSDLNSKNADFAPLILDNQLIFASSRSVAVEKDGEITWTNDAFNQHYIANIDYKNAAVNSIKPLRHYVGRDINDAPMSYTKNKDLVAITSNNFMDGIRPIAGSGLMMDLYFYKTKTFKEWNHESEQFFPFNAGVQADQPFSTGQPSLSSDGSAVYFCSNRAGGFGGYDLYVSYRTQSGWTKPKNLGPEINTPGNEMTPFVDGYGRLYFSSDYHHGFGGMDVFTAERMPNGIDWGNVLNLGKPVNSPYDDMYFCFDGQSRYGFFSSNRLSGGGNEDIYMVKQIRALPEPPKPELTAGTKLVLTDIYEPNQIELTGLKNDELNDFVKALKANKELVVQIYSHSDSRGSYNNNLNLTERRAKAAANFLINKGIPAKQIKYQGFGEKYLINNCKDGVTCSDEEHRKNRRLEFIIIGRISPAGQFIQEHMTEIAIKELSAGNSSVNRTASNNANRSNPSNVSKTLPSPSRNTNYSKKPVRKSHYAIGDVIEVANIYYEHDKAAVDKSSPGLKELIDVLNEHQHVKIEIGSHTDANGSASYNLGLSQRRANAVKNYLISRGISASRLVAKGYGESKILNHCKNGVPCSKAEHAVNRRTEFKVIGQTGFRIGDIIKVDNINYATGSSKLDKRDMRGLNEIVKILKENSISVEIRSHTDSRGDAAKNLKLSQERAKAVYDYLLEQGVNKYRLKYKGYGETILLNGCKDGVPCSNAKHAENRRTDFKVIGLK